MKKLLLILSTFFYEPSHGQYHVSASDTLLEHLMIQDTANFGHILNNRDALKVQIVYSQINRDKHNKPHITEYTFNAKNDLYFYPASTVKMIAAFLALEKLNELHKKGINKDTRTVHEQILSTYPVINDSLSNIAYYIKQIFLVSDNEAFNRLYEFLGQEYIQQKLKEKGYDDAIIRHRLQIALSKEQNKTTNPVNFYDEKGNLVYRQPETYSQASFPQRSVLIGDGYYKNDSLVKQPFEFGEKNRVYLQDLHHMLQSVIFPETVSKKQRFKLKDNDYSFLRKWMSTYPAESKSPIYDKTNYWDSYCKFLYYGSDPKSPVENNIRIFNKVGDAYGFLTDVAYVVDLENNIEFMLSATIYCNKDGIFNDDVYDYDTVGYPFMKQLGRLIYNYEKQRNRKFVPNLQAFKFNYHE